jgi:predicted nucleic acid-binding protein
VWLVDTSVWVETFRRGGPALDTLLPFDEVVTAPPIVQEVLQGIDDARAFAVARNAMLALPVIEAPLDMARFIEAAQLYRSARRLGITLRSSVDCLIAACAIRHGIGVLHVDRDFDAIARVAPLLSRRIGVNARY